VPLPPLTPEQRAAALEKAAAARKARAEVKERLKKSGVSIAEVLNQGDTDDVIGKMRVSAVLESMPGVGKARAAKIMERLEISPTPPRPRSRAPSSGRRSSVSSVPRSPEVILDPVPQHYDVPRTGEARLTVLSGPSGVGKDAVLAAVRRRHPEVWVSTSVTTRKPRPSETDGVEYHFVDRDRVAEMISSGELLEHAEYAGNIYGTPRGPVLRRLAEGGRRSWSSSCRACGRCASSCRTPSSCSWPRRRSRSWSGGWSAGGPSPEDVIRERLDQARIELASESGVRRRPGQRFGRARRR
jgi:guanylate kinase